MPQRTFWFKSEEGTEIYVCGWMPDEKVNVKGIVQMSFLLCSRSQVGQGLRGTSKYILPQETTKEGVVET